MFPHGNTKIQSCTMRDGVIHTFVKYAMLTVIHSVTYKIINYYGNIETI